MPVFSGEDLAKSAKLLTSAAIVVADPSGLAAGAAGLDAVLTYFDLKTASHPDLKKLEKETAKKLTARFRKPDFHCPKGADIHLPQMIEAGLATPADFVDCNLDAEKIIAQMIAQLKEPEHRKAEMIEAFRCLYLPVLRGLMDDPRMLAVLDPMIKRKQLQQGDNIAAKLDNLSTLPRDQLELLAGRFEIAGAADMSDGQIQEQLTLKARDYRAYRKLIDGIDDRVAGLGNLKAAAKDAAERLDFDGVEELMLRVDEVETSIAAEAKEIRAANALLRGRVQQAYDIYCAAADSFASIDPLEPARRRALYSKSLYDHGQAFGGAGLELAAQMLQDVLRVVARHDDGALWAATQNNLGSTLQALGSQKAGTETLEAAVHAHQSALLEWTQEAVPLDWAMTQNNLGNALRELGSLKASTKLLEAAVSAIKAALLVFTRDLIPFDWARAQTNLGNALVRLGELRGNTETLKSAVKAFQSALLEWTQEAAPFQWATAQNNLGNALQALGGQEAGAETLEAAVNAYEAALLVWTQGAAPLDWAMTQNNLGNALKTLGARETGTDTLQRAVQAYANALLERTRVAVPLDWAGTQNNLGNALRVLGAREGGTDTLQRAVQAYENAMLERTREAVPLDWAGTQGNLTNLELAFFDEDGDGAHLERAAAYLAGAREVFEEAGASQYLKMADRIAAEIEKRRGTLAAD